MAARRRCDEGTIGPGDRRPAKCFVSPDRGMPGTEPWLSEISSADEVRARTRERSVVGLDDKIENKTQEAAGKVEQNAGEAGIR